MKLNVVHAIGNLVKDAETKIMSNGKTKQVFTIALNDDYKKAGTEEWIKRPYFVNCYVVGKEYKALTKGKKIFINGKIVTKNYEVERGNSKEKRTSFQIEVFALDFMFQKDSGEYEQVRAEVNGNIKDIEEEAEVPF